MGPVDKLMEPVEGMPLLRRQALSAVTAGRDGPVIVTLPPADSPRHAARSAAVADLPVTALVVDGADEGMSASLRAVRGHLDGLAGLMILPADMPEINAGDLRLLATAFHAAGDAILRAASADGRPGHPVVLPARCFPALADLRGDAGARDILRAEGDAVRLVRLGGQRALIDLDTPVDWDAWRAGEFQPRT
jgi:CTP:molybdopterin cytidylyltransferase MocA